MFDTDTPMTPLSFLERASTVHPDQVMAVDGGRRLSYREAAEHVTRLAHALRGLGVQPGDRVAYLAPNTTEVLLSHFAVPLAGGVLVTINTRLAPAEVQYICEHSSARVIFVDPQLWAQVEPLRDGLPGATFVLLPDDQGQAAAVPGVIDYTDLVADAETTPIPWEVEDEDTTMSINYTSGTTGRPKGVMYTHRGAYLNSLNQIIHQGFSRQSVYLWTLPMFHCNGWCTAWAVTAVAATHICLRAVRGPDIWRLINEEGVTHLCGAPTVLSIMAADEAAAPLSRPLTVTTAGAAPSPTIIEKFTRLNATIVHVYGLTETYGPYTVCEVQPDWADLDPGELANQMARQGVAMVASDRVRVIDTLHESEGLIDVPMDGATMGEIVMRGNITMKGYFDDPEATAEAFRGGWFHSGDLGVMHPRGYIQLLDRAKDVIVSGGENISTVEVEQAVLRHPAVTYDAVIVVPDERWC